MLPEPIRSDHINVDFRYIPFHKVGGDYCQVHLMEPQCCYITMCDVTGHGIGSAMLATRVSSEERRWTLERKDPCDIVHSLNQFVLTHFEGIGLYVTFVAARIDLEQHLVTWSGAGHPSPLLIKADEQRSLQLESQHTLIGASDDILKNTPQDVLGLAPGDRMLFYTDGLSEAADHEGKLLGTNGLAQIANRCMESDLFDLSDAILQQIEEYRAGSSDDDMTLIAAEIQHSQ